MSALSESPDITDATLEDEEEKWRRIFVPRVGAWAKDRGLLALLGSVREHCPHVMGLASEPDAPPALTAGRANTSASVPLAPKCNAPVLIRCTLR